ncbi:MAG: ATP-dependent helicase HrpB [Gemmatimonadaceae bacterium]|nr:ATP-dependent helicase HrpB [Gemmatimonadaceae bacterium]
MAGAPSLPIDEALPALREALAARAAAVLRAPPGAGKTTRVPLALLDAPWLAGARIVMLEPRRLAARAAARWMAAQLHEPVGATVGYRMRMDTRVGPATRIEVVTEGVLTRFLQDDPGLEGIGLVIFDEFHERSLQADVGLALALETQRVLRPDLRLLVMSATLDVDPVARLLGGAPVIHTAGRSYPVDVRYVPPRQGATPERGVVAAVRTVLARDAGDVLVFLPGAREIRRVQSALDGESLGDGVHVLPLYGDLSPAEQDRAIAPSAPGARKVVLATSIAETSLTIEGVRVVIDSGLARVPRFSPRTGMTRLETVRVSRASAEQRRGRAGRVAPGVCYRLWPEQEQQHLLPRAAPEILDADLAPLVLELAVGGIADPGTLAWLDAPPAAALAHARELLAALGALDADGRITVHGRRMAELAMHPRLAHMVLVARELGEGALACEVAALLGERDILRAEPGSGAPDADLRLRIDVVRAAARGGRSVPEVVSGLRVAREACRRVRAQADAWMRQLGIARAGSGDVEACGLVLAFAYPDRIAQRRPGERGRFLLRNGSGAVLAGAQALADAAYLAVAELDGKRPESTILLAAPVTLEALEAHAGAQIACDAVIAWDPEARAVVARERERLGALVLRDRALRDPDPDAVVAAFVEGIARAGVGALPWSDAARGVRARLQFLHALDPSWPDVSDAALTATLETWLGPHLYGCTRWDDLRALDLAELLRGLLTWEQRTALDELAPTHYTVPSGSRVPIDYGDPAAPVLAVRLQEMFGCAETPRIARGAVPLTVHLLSPARRPVQVTRDLAGFWRSTYFDVRKELKGRYPKHYWPDDPMQATPTSRVKPRG